MAENDLPPFYSENIIAEGNLTSDPKDISRKQNGSVVVGRIACNYRRFDGEEGTVYRNFKVTNTASGNVLNSARKGDRLLMMGRVEGNNYEDSDGNIVESENILVDFIGSSFRFNEVKQLRQSGYRRDDDEEDDDEDDDEEDDRPRRRRSSARRSSRASSRRTSSRRRGVTSRGDDDDDDEYMDE